jgi:hypothetical protein
MQPQIEAVEIRRKITVETGDFFGIFQMVGRPVLRRQDVHPFCIQQL